MTDGVIKGTGNSRWLRVPPNIKQLCPDFDSMLDVMIQGRFPFDMNGLNAEGWQVMGTLLNKPNVLTDTTRSALGLTGDATINQAFAAIPTAKMLHIIVTASAALIANQVAMNDLIPLDDVSAGTGKKIPVSALIQMVMNNTPRQETTFQKLMTGRLI